MIVIGWAVANFSRCPMFRRRLAFPITAQKRETALTAFRWSAWSVLPESYE